MTVALSAAALLGSAGCGIRGTSVPVDAGPAPSRVSCQVPGDRTPPPDSPQEVAADVYLVCSTQIVPVGRGVRYPDSRLEDDRLRIARTLLAELRAQPSGPETAGGFSTEVPDGLEVGGRRAGDPEHALRLSREPGEVPPYGLAQLVCTYAGTPAVGGSGSVLLGGPGDEPPRSFRCTPGLRAQPEAVQSPGVGLE
ncbi:MAG TPA: hypothetical protein DEQ61_04050 [Streptomyces sp.]|nr:hypothetical protein [Streptomyces sp.]